MTLLPLADGQTVRTEAGVYTPYVFDPTIGLNPKETFQAKIGTKNSATVLFVPGTPDSIQKLAEKGGGIPSDQLFTGRLPNVTDSPLDSSFYASKEQAPVPYQVGAEQGMIPGQLFEARTFTIPAGGFNTKTQSLTVQPGLGGSRSIMFNQGMGASTSTTSSSRSSGASRTQMQDPRSVSRW